MNSNVGVKFPAMLDLEIIEKSLRALGIEVIESKTYSREFLLNNPQMTVIT